MTGGDFKVLCANIGKGDTVVFQDKDGNFHQIFTARRYRYGYVVLQETVIGKPEWPLTTTKPPQELLDYMDKVYDETPR